MDDKGGTKGSNNNRSRRVVRYVDTNVIMKRTIFGGFVGGVTGRCFRCRMRIDHQEVARPHQVQQ